MRRSSGLARDWIVAFASASFGATGAGAAQLDLSLSTTTIEVGQRFEVQVSGSGFEAGTDGGDFSLYWTGNLAFVGLAVEDPPWDVSAVDASGAVDGYIGSVDVFSADDTPGNGGTPFSVARLTLEATAEGPASVSIGTDQVGWSLQGGWLDYLLSPELPIEVQPLPEPATATALGLAPLVLGALARRRRAATKPRDRA